MISLPEYRPAAAERDQHANQHKHGKRDKDELGDLLYSRFHRRTVDQPVEEEKHDANDNELDNDLNCTG
jgi:hypothetical protein